MCRHLPERSNIALGKIRQLLALIQSAIANEGDAWSSTLDSVGSYYERVLSRKADLNELAQPSSFKN